MGFNATGRRRGSKRGDIVLLVAAVVVVAGLVAWVLGAF